MIIQNTRWLLLAAIGVFLLAATAVSAATFTLGAGTGSEADGAYINEGAVTVNYAAITRYWLGGANSGSDVYVPLNWPALKDSIYGRTVDACSLFVKTQALVV